MKIRDIKIEVQADETILFEGVCTVMYRQGLLGVGFEDLKYALTEKGIWFSQKRTALIQTVMKNEKSSYERIAEIKDVKFMRRKGFQFIMKERGCQSNKIFFDGDCEKVKEIIQAHINDGKGE